MPAGCSTLPVHTTMKKAMSCATTAPLTVSMRWKGRSSTSQFFSTTLPCPMKIM